MNGIFQKISLCETDGEKSATVIPQSRQIETLKLS